MDEPTPDTMLIMWASFAAILESAMWITQFAWSIEYFHAEQLQASILIGILVCILVTTIWVFPYLKKEYIQIIDPDCSEKRVNRFRLLIALCPLVILALQASMFIFFDELFFPDGF